MDLAETNRGLVVVELNPISGSGRYRGNDVPSLMCAWLRGDAILRRQLLDAFIDVCAEDARRVAAARARCAAQSERSLLIPDHLLP
jgi:hypothetical protein